MEEGEGVGWDSGEFVGEGVVLEEGVWVWCWGGSQGCVYVYV